MSQNSAAMPQHIKLKKPQAQSNNAKLDEGRQRLPINVFSNLVWLVLNMGVQIWYTPFLIANLGVAVYGLIPLTTSMVSYMTLLTQGYNGAVSRFLTIDLARNDMNMATRTFNTGMVVGLILAGILIPVVLIVCWFTPQIFDVPIGYERDAQWLVLFTLLSSLVITLTSIFAVPSYAYHRFDLRLLVNVIRLIVQVGSIIVLFMWLSPQLWQVGFVLVISSLLFGVGHGVLWRKLAPDLVIKFKYFKTSLLRHMVGFSGWVLINQVGALLFLSIDLVVANIIFGSEVAGRYGAVLIFPMFLRTSVAVISDVLRPIIVGLYAQGSTSKLIHFSHLSVKSVGLAMALPIGLVCGLGRPLLTVWLGPEFSDLSWLIVALIAHLCVNLSTIPLFSVQVATNNVRIPGIVTLVMGITNVGLAVTLALWSGAFISIAIAGAIVLTAKNSIFTPIYNARILKISWWSFYPDLVVGIVGFIAVSLTTYWISSTWILGSWLQLILVAITVSGIYFVLSYFLGLNADDQRLLKSEIRRRVNSGTAKNLNDVGATSPEKDKNTNQTNDG